jgi:hypothetical protein
VYVRKINDPVYTGQKVIGTLLLSYVKNRYGATHMSCFYSYFIVELVAHVIELLVCDLHRWWWGGLKTAKLTV